MKEKKRLIIDMPPATLKTLAVEGINQNKSRKAYIEQVLEEKATEITKNKK